MIAFHLNRNVSNVKLTANANNAAYTNRHLDLHNDLPYNGDVPGLIFLFMLQQHTGEGGESLASDGFYAAEILRSEHPAEFDSLVNSNIYYGCHGIDQNGEGDSPYEYNRLERTSALT